MIDYIEEMMKTAGVEKDFAYLECHRGRSAIGCPNFDCHECEGGEKLKEVYKYPYFTAEKQLEIIKLIGNETVLEIEQMSISNQYWLKTYSQQSGKNQDFTQALAQLTIELIKAGELDKQKIKEILEDD